jgi:uncharacterized protein (TIGR00297 family)
VPSKAIPPARDRLQSRILVWATAPLLCVLSIRAVVIALHLAAGDPRRTHFLAGLMISFAFALLVWIVRAATPAAAACGGMSCLLLTDCTTTWPPSLLRSGLPPLVLLFVFTFAATRYGHTRKEARGLSEPSTGRRASQVIANLGVAALCAAFSRNHVMLSSMFAFGACIAALAEATADTVSSEVGQAIAGTAVLITNLRRVQTGTDGAISVPGTLAGLLGAAVVTFVALPPQSFKSLVFPAIFAAATAGLFFDSLLGATLERKGWIGNDLVNFASTVFSAAVLYPLGCLAMSFLHV